VNPLARWQRNLIDQNIPASKTIQVDSADHPFPIPFKDRFPAACPEQAKSGIITFGMLPPEISNSLCLPLIHASDPTDID
jgi:hypothetical protein